MLRTKQDSTTGTNHWEKNYKMQRNSNLETSKYECACKGYPTVWLCKNKNKYGN